LFGNHLTNLVTRLMIKGVRQYEKEGEEKLKWHKS